MHEDHAHHHAEDQHPGDLHNSLQDPATAGNIPIAAGETAETALVDLHQTLLSFTLDQMIDDIDNFNFWTTTSITYSFPTEQADDYNGTGRDGTLAVFSDAQIAAAREIMAHYDDIIALKINDAGDDINADTRFYNSTLTGTAGGAPAGPGIAGDIWVYNYVAATVDARDLNPGSYQYHLIVHEIGHTLGLSHTSFVDGDNYTERARYAQNNAAYSAMSYLTAGSAGLVWNTGYSATPMLADVAALQSMYGANMETRTGNTVYGFNSTADRAAFDFDGQLDAYGRIGAITIWDAGGIDTLDMSGFAQDGFINLNDGTHSSVGGNDLNVAIAKNAIIENAVGGAGDDVILGNAEANTIHGGTGADTIDGGEGRDFLYGDSVAPVASTTHGAAVLNGSDTVSIDMDLTGATALTFEMLISFDPAVTNTQWFGSMPGGWSLVYDGGNGGLWYYANSKWAFMGAKAIFADGKLHRLSVVIGESSVIFYVDGQQIGSTNNMPDLTNLDASERLSFSHDGAIADLRVFTDIRSKDEIQGNLFSAIDHATADLAANVVFDGAAVGAQDTANGNLVTISAGATAATVTLVSQDDVLRGGGGGDALFGGVGADSLDGGAGIDRADYSASLAGVQINLDAGTGTGGDAQGDILVSIENVTGSSFGDFLRGSGDDNVLSGGEGADILMGGGGADQLNGGAGRDTVSYADALAGVTVDLLNKTSSDGDTLQSIEIAVGSDFGDTLIGSDGGNILNGGGGDDVIRGGGGKDVLIGGAGADVFVFGVNDGRDIIEDFDTAVDKIKIEGPFQFDDIVIRNKDVGAIVKFGISTLLLDAVPANSLTADHFIFDVI